jgi:hypothetical protein
MPDSLGIKEESLPPLQGSKWLWPRWFNISASEVHPAGAVPDSSIPDVTVCSHLPHTLAVFSFYGLSFPMAWILTSHIYPDNHLWFLQSAGSNQGLLPRHRLWWST